MSTQNDAAEQTAASVHRASSVTPATTRVLHAGTSGCRPRTNAEGQHRAIREHAFVLYHGDESLGCGRIEDDEPHARCGFYRRHHATMAEQ